MKQATILSLKTNHLMQQTLKSPISCSGIGLHSGIKINMTLKPAPENHGIVFIRTDLAGQGAALPALWSNVQSTIMNTGLLNDTGARIGTVEHLMSALSGSGIDNCLIEISGPEVPVMDGSSQPFLFLIDSAGIVQQSAPRCAIRILRPISVTDGDKFAGLFPSENDNFSLHFEIDFPCEAIAKQERTVTMVNYKSEISKARTFGFEQDIAILRAAGLARGGSLDNAVVVDSTGTKILNDGGLRYRDEFVRHKILDAVGDLYLAGAAIIGHFHGIKSGHTLNNKLLHALFADETCWERTTITKDQKHTTPQTLIPQAVNA